VAVVAWWVFFIGAAPDCCCRLYRFWKVHYNAIRTCICHRGEGARSSSAARPECTHPRDDHDEYRRQTTLSLILNSAVQSPATACLFGIRRWWAQCKIEVQQP
jgi:hypothetical protein